MDLRAGVGVGQGRVEELARGVKAFGCVVTDFVVEEGEQAVVADGAI